MPLYKLSCSECGEILDKKLSFSQYDEVKLGQSVVDCPSCAKAMSLVFAPGRLGMVMKEGLSGGWTTKSEKERKYRDNRHQAMGKRQKDNVFEPSLQPNYNGEETGTWKEAQEVARKVGGDTAAATYAPVVAKEKQK